MSKKLYYSNISHHFQYLLIADLFSLFSFITSKPLYFVCLLFFLPYIVQFISFISPLLISSSLLFLLSLLTISPRHEKPTRYGFFGNACQKVVDALRTQIDDNVEFHLFDPLALIASELEVCVGLETVVSHKGIEDNPDVVEGLLEESQTLTYNAREELVGIPDQRNDELVASKSLDNLWIEHETGSVASQGLTNLVGEKAIKVPQHNDELEAFEPKIQSIGNLRCKWNTSSMVSQEPSCNVGEKANGIHQQKDELGADHEHQEHKTTLGVMSNVGENHVQAIDQNGKENSNLIMSLNHVGFGSIRKDKEWKRTLASKLYEERQTAKGGEGMDLLWEIDEVCSGTVKATNKGKKEKMIKQKDVDMYKEVEEGDSQLCCLQALRFSTGRMNLGIGKLNSMKLSKAFKGIGTFVRRERKVL